MSSIRYFDILNQTVQISSDSQKFIDVVMTDYAWFAVEPPVAASIRVTARFSDPAPCISFESGDGEQVVSLNGHPDPVLLAYQKTLDHLYCCFNDHFILHAAVGAMNGSALAISGPSGAGKTTAILSLLEHGYTYFSDDICPVEKATGLVWPYPRSAWKVGGKGQGVRGKNPVSAAELATTEDLRATPLGALVLLVVDEAGDRDVLVDVMVRPEVEGDLARALHGIGEVTARREEQGLTALRVKCLKSCAGVQSVLDRMGDAIFASHRVDPRPESFQQHPVLRRIDAGKAAFSLLPGLKGKVEDGKAGMLLVQLAGLLQNVSCFTLTVGKSDVMQRLLLEAHGQHDGYAR